MFLKRIEIQGFKSFADKMVINFEDEVTGIVGPNGCGKSNIADAIRWVLGEQSVKSLRGNKMSDVIFSGSLKRKALGMAEVSLIFNNKNRNFNYDNDEIEITRRIYNDDQSGEYLINRRSVRLKDIQELIMDSGLGKDTLSMISQGNITHFAEAKPIDRRLLFEDAAGVGKYKKKKLESLAKLEKTSINLERTFDILKELEKQLTPLKNQAEKAMIFRDKKNQLSQIEINFLVNEIEKTNQQNKEIQNQLFEIETINNIHLNTIDLEENEILDIKKRIKNKNDNINNLQEKLVDVINNISKLESRKIELNEKRKYEFEKANNQDKIKHFKDVINELSFDCLERKNHIQKTNDTILELSKELSIINHNLTDISFKKEELFNVLRKYENKKELLINLIKNPFNNNSQFGVKAVIDNKQSLFGIMDIVGYALKAKDGYEEALKAAMGGMVYHIVAINQKSAKNAIEFLKRNKSGRATFIPLDVLNERNLTDSQKIICKSQNGYIGLMSDFIFCDQKYQTLNHSLFGNVVICDNLDSATELSNLLFKQVKIVTLDGDIINRGGMMSGGRSKNESSIITGDIELKNIEVKINEQKNKLSLILDSIKNYNLEKQEIQNKITNLRIALAKKESILEIKQEKLAKIKADLELISPDENFKYDDFKDELIKELNDNYILKDELTVNIKMLRNELLNDTNYLEQKEINIKNIRKEIDATKNNERLLLTSSTKLITQLDIYLNRLSSEYQMTFEYAKTKINNIETTFTNEEINQLRNEIDSLGNINMNAPEEYEELDKRYQFVKNNYDELKISQDKILNIIEDMDEIMKKQFKDMFNKINEELGNTFVKLFNGGSAKLVLEDADDLLNSGIDIDVQPPGKSVKSIRLFSGGEKTLIAICVLFAILKVRPVPLVVFDEVEAALDQVNVEKFAKYIKSVSDITQFIVITHRPGTMAQCDSLYGVTMQKQGISEMIKIKLVDAIEMNKNKENR